MQIVLDYGFRPAPRYGYGKQAHPRLYSIIDQRRDVFASYLTQFASFREALQRIPLDQPADDLTSPFWNNGFIPGLDAISLHCLLGMQRPQMFCEIGSGHSTRFARNAVRSHGLPTRVVSIDPHPRVEIDAICDVVLRQPAEDVDPAFFDSLQAGDILFVDSSHRSFTNTDVTALYLDVYPRLKPGVIVHSHDIFLPYDYPEEWGDRFYNEQYLLAASLLTKVPSFEILLANAFINCNHELNSMVDGLFDHPLMAEIAAHGWIVQSGWSFWMRKT